MPWAVAAAGISAAAGIGSSIMQSNAADKASQRAVNAQQQARDQARADLEPWRAAGGNALNVVSDLSGANGPDAYDAALGNFRASPGYQWQLDQGLRAVDAGAAAKGLLRSGATLKAEQAYGAGLADQDFTNYYNRLFQLTNLGESAAAGQAAASQTAGQGIAQTDLSQGSALTSIYGNAAQGIGNSVNQGFNNYYTLNRTNSLYGGGGSFFGVPGNGYNTDGSLMTLA